MGTGKHLYDATDTTTMDSLSTCLASVQYVKSKVSGSSGPMKVRGNFTNNLNSIASMGTIATN